MKTLLLLLFFVFALGEARAGVTVSLSSSVQNSARGTELIFSGTIINTSATDKVFLNDLAFSLSGASATCLAPEVNSFFANVPGILLPGESYTVSEVFRVMLVGGAPAGGYGGTVTLLGGVDIFSATNLAGASFTVLSPAVSIVATDASAAEFGGDSGSFTVTRSGGTGVELPVTLGIGGTAVNGATFSAIASSLTLPIGAASATVVIAPIPNDTAEGERTAILAIAPSPLYNIDALAADTVTIHDKPTDDWRFQNFGGAANSPAAADAADFEGDGIANLVEFALGLSPLLPDFSALPAPVLSGGFLTLSYVPNTLATDVTFTVESSTDLTSWGTADVDAVTIGAPPGGFTFRYKHPPGQSPGAFLRLRVSR